MAFNQLTGILGQVTPAANATSNLYLCPEGTRASLSITACNVGSSATTISVIVRPITAGTATRLIFNWPLAPAGQQGASFDQRALIVGPGNVVQVTSVSGTVEFTAIGYTAPNTPVNM